MTVCPMLQVGSFQSENFQRSEYANGLTFRARYESGYRHQDSWERGIAGWTSSGFVVTGTAEPTIV